MSMWFVGAKKNYNYISRPNVGSPFLKFMETIDFQEQ